MVTINEVAEAAGVSISTVSRVMNQSGIVSAETCRRVMEAVRELGYIPNISAKKAAHKSNKLIGVLFPDISNNVFGRIMQGINSVVTPLGYNLIICETDGELEKEIHFLNVLKNKQVDGVIMANIHIPGEHMMWIHRNHIPVIYVCQDVPEFDLKVPCSSVNMDNKQAICDMVHFLYHMGHRQIAFVGGPLHDLSAGKKRYDGYMKGMKECSLPIRQDMIAFQDAFTIDAGYRGMHEIYEKSSALPTAVLCACDNMAVGAIDFMYDNHIKVPEHISVTGVDDTELAGAIRPSLTTIRHATPDTGVKAAHLLLEYLAAPDFDGGAFNVPYQILRRQSVLQIRSLP
ncbi:LacI family DNA-binding transcriptional regulator [Lachnoclostridium sp. Marseille-P6806]|uniref:LacI family DNA-binding transcriptional regulator n=1 Tax=Lachnoclostridium sp. Marseille-P6806 TaxID=2364793 RepID=UPI00102F7211|nr:LacI family DNA-binding transcriptional regulator [Lachnoclostridium sp. Marseille-P6806]